MRISLFSHFQAVRPYTLCYPCLVTLAGVYFGETSASPLIAIGAVSAGLFGWVAALYGCDFYDRRLDAVAKPHRPIPSGKISPRTAFVSMLILVALGISISYALGWTCMLLAGAIGLSAYLYARYLKARGILGHISRGLTTGLAFLFGVAATGVDDVLAFLGTALIFVFHDAASNAVGALRDVEGDRKAGYGTLPVKYGQFGTLLFVVLFGVISYAMATSVMLSTPSPSIGPSLFLVTAGVFFVVAIFLTFLRFSPSAARRALLGHKVLTMERVVLACALIAVTQGSSFAIALVVPCLSVTLGTQIWLRDRYEGVPTPADANHPLNPEELFHRCTAIRKFVTAQLAQIEDTSRFIPSDWQARLKITIVNLDYAMFFDISDGQLVELSAEEANGGHKHSRIEIETKDTTFFRLFRERTMTPHIAYLTKRVRIRCSISDLIRLRQTIRVFYDQKDRPKIAVRPRRVEHRDCSGCPENQANELQGRLIAISDTTLRDGEQMPGVAFDLLQKTTIAQELDRLGVPLIEAGFPAVSENERLAVEEVAHLGLNAVVQAIARANRSDIDLAASTGVGSIAVFIGTSDLHIREKLQSTPKEILSTVREAIQHAKSFGVQVVFAAEDATRTSVDFLHHISDVAVEAGADVIAIPDTVGICMPWQFQTLVSDLVSRMPIPIAVHCHNDFGMATANSIAGLRGGASGVQCSLLGIGERAGNAPLEEVLAVLQIVYGCTTGVDLTHLPEAARIIAAQIDGFEILPNKAIVGANAFRHESGLHAQGVMRNPSTYEPFPPEEVGSRRSFVFGKHSGRSALRQILENYGHSLDNTSLLRLFEFLKARGERHAALDEAEMLALIPQYSNSSDENTAKELPE